MHSVRASGGFVVRLDPGEEILEVLGQFVRDHELQGANITGIGAVKSTTIGYFDLEAKSYHKKDLPGEMELISLTGNLTWVGNDPMIHAHVVLAGPDYAAVAGHLFSATIAVTGELFIHDTGVRIRRAQDERSGLNLIHGKD
jgi:hypothetical protein